jgi:NAD(P)-dependent dehydrogenase (short-subunit alcohol dehydrogenase family)
MATNSPDEYDRWSLAGKVALVTGGSRGLGREMVRAFARQGADVVIASRKYDACERLAEEIGQEFGRKALAVACNVGDWGQCERLVEQAYDQFGHVDVLVNDAGMSPVYSSIEEVSEELFDKVVAVNLKGPFRLSALVGSRMARGAGGSIINLSSIASIRPTPDVIPYAMAKSGLNTLTEGLARTFGPKVRVNAILAGPFLTDVSKAWDMEAFQHVAESTIALKRGGRPDEIVGAAMYFASDAASFCTGAILRLDGGSA